jgi:uncharacterized SAM-binding protein YcdF (DUF218 family)
MKQTMFPFGARLRLGFVLTILAGLALGVLGYGFELYVRDARAWQERVTANIVLPIGGVAADRAIIVLTGGSERIATGLNLLHQGWGRKLFISGIGAGADLTKIFNGLERRPELETCCIVLGQEASDTVGNARESLAWLRQEGFHHAILVTANYHMRRSLLEFVRLDVEGNVSLTPYSVAPQRVDLAAWWKRPPTARLLLEEYAKLLIAFARFIWFTEARP